MKLFELVFGCLKHSILNNYLFCSRSSVTLQNQFYIFWFSNMQIVVDIFILPLFEKSFTLEALVFTF